ncbi:MAG TPA: NAD-dependent epimerase/dehydratase family protein [Candidatus Omnitrophota bacterium]|nr:NAD-dependent epimerase/dehydratase family protein [Candidatus Omnitrophota bacterium]
MFFKDKNILVTGATGFVGSNLLLRLVETGARIRAVVHQRPPVIDDVRIDYVPGDLTRQEDCQSMVRGIDYVFHCAASTSGAAVISRTPLVHVTPNIVMNARLLEAAYMAGVKKFLWLSSSTGYPVTGDRPVREEEMFLGEPYEKYFGVGWMKRYTEILCRLYSQKLSSSLVTIVLRPTNIYGEYDDFHFETSHVFAALVRRVVERHDPLEVWGTGEDVRDLIYVQDFVDAMLAAMEKMDSYCAMNIGAGEGHSVKELLNMMLECDGFRNARLVFDPAKPSMIPVRLVDIGLARQLIGFSPGTSIQEGIRKTIAWYKFHPVRTGEANRVS